MAGHTGLRKSQALAREGKPIPGPIGWSFAGSLNYGYMRICTAIQEAHRRSDEGSFRAARAAWLDNQAEQLEIGHWCHGKPTANSKGQCEQGCPQPHSDFILDAETDLWLWALGLGADPSVRDPELAASCEAAICRSVALARLFNVNGIVAMPGVRAKNDTEGDEDEGLDANDRQWRNRPLDALLAVAEGRRPPRYVSPCINAVKRLLARPNGEALRRRMANAPLPKLRLPIEMARLRGGGYLARLVDTPDARRVAGKDGLTAVRFVPGMREPELHYDREAMAWPLGVAVEVG